MERLAAYLRMAGAIAVASAMAGCLSAGAAISRRVQIPLASYASSQMTAAKQVVLLDFPAMEIYNPKGILIYRTGSDRQDADVIRALPQGLRDLKPVGGRPSLRERLSAFPQLRGSSGAAATHGHYVVLSITLTGCGECDVRGGELQAAQRRRSASIHFDVIGLELEN